MANAFTPTSAWRFGGPNQKSLIRIEGTAVIDTAGGDTAGDLPATLFGLTKVIGKATFIKSDDSKAYFGVPSYSAGTSVMIAGGASNAVMDLPTGTYKVCIEGYA